MPADQAEEFSLPSASVLLFLKAPREGFVKKRLADGVGHAEATRIYRFLVQQQLASIPTGQRVEIRFTPDDAEAEMRAWLGPYHEYFPQGDGDLGVRLSRGFSSAFERGAGLVIALGGDCPDLDVDCLMAARRSLLRCDLVLGPATDGGCYLIGLRGYTSRLFSDIPWSSSAVLRIIRERAVELGRSFDLLAEKEDIDDIAGWQRFRRRRLLARQGGQRGNGQTVAVVIPALNEAEVIDDAIANVKLCLPFASVFSVDGGSHDRTAEIARAAGAQVVSAPRGRGNQCRSGAEAAFEADWYLFLHADSRLPANAGPVVERFIGNPKANAATFRLRFDDGGWFLAVCAWFTRFDSVFTRFGDQGILIRRSFYDTLGGFPAWPLFEDVALLQRVRRATKLHSLPAVVTTSARRFRRSGVLRQQVLNTRLLLRYLLGASPESLAAIYRTDPSPQRQQPPPPPETGVHRVKEITVRGWRGPGSV